MVFLLSNLYVYEYWNNNWSPPHAVIQEYFHVSANYLQEIFFFYVGDIFNRIFIRSTRLFYNNLMSLANLVEIDQSSCFELQMTEKRSAFFVYFTYDRHDSGLHHLRSGFYYVTGGNSESMPIDNNFFKVDLSLVSGDISFRIDIENPPVIYEEYVFIGNPERHCRLFMGNAHE